GKRSLAVPKSLEERRAVLLDMQKRFRHLAGEFQEAVEEVANSNQGIIDSSPGNADNESADTASDLYEQERSLTMRYRYRDRLADVELALQRIRDGSYGRCAACGETIPEGRLDAMPETPYCVDHAASNLAVDDQPTSYPKPWPEQPWTA